MVSNLQFDITKPRSRPTLRKEARELLNDTMKAYDQAGGLLSITQAVRLYVISKVTLYCRINGHCNQVLYSILKQRLTSEEEESIKSWVLEI